MTLSKNFIYQEIERKLPELQIYEYEYSKPYDEDAFYNIVLRVYEKYGLLKHDITPNEIKLNELGINDYDLNLIYQNYLRRINDILVKNDEKVSKIIDEAITHTGRFKDALLEPVTKLQLYRVIKGNKVNDTSIITENEYDNEAQYKYYGTLMHRHWYSTYLERRKRIMREKRMEAYRIKKDAETKANEQINFGYKGLDKIKSLYEHYGKVYVEPKQHISNYFPLKQNIKTYSLHKVRPRNSWLIDLMKTGKIYYLLAINVNTRYLIAEPTNAEIEECKY